MTNARPKRTVKLQLMLDPDELEVIDDWRFENRLPSRAAAVRELMRRGLSADGVEFDREPGRATSRDFGIPKK